ncbi:MAG TPA: bifunctional precorrin-2 dehydrogenase/sirohydrochlorin ferrochelatase [Thermodesulfobacteriota bacterium]|nr:bifunctional precorrin-2 dehydrogenase/sirohydrochlorin ferrochelatase [Thermodesulfobacteriota bacterium]
MKYYPIFLDIRNKPCVVIGGGDVAERKVVSLLSAGARITVVSPEFTISLEGMGEDGKILLIKRPYQEGDLKEAFLAYAATNEEDINNRVYMEGEKEGILLNVVDEPDMCDFIVPSVVKRGALSIAISTGGASPAFAKRLRLEMEERYGEEYSVFLEIMAAIRQKLLTKGSVSDKNKKIFNKLASSSMPDMIKMERWNEVDETIVSLLGEDFSLASLGIKKA